MAKAAKGPSSGQVFGERLLAARLAAGISQKKLGELAKIDPGVASARINRYERGIHLPDYQTAARLARALGVPTSFLFTDDPLLASLILETSGLNPAGLNLLLKKAREIRGRSRYRENK